MKILVTANMVPFMHGGASYHIAGVVRELQRAGHEVELLRLPFRFSPEKDIARAMEHAQSLDFIRPNGVTIDQVISLQFPGYGISHPDHRVWVMHQHRAVYELYDAAQATAELKQLRAQVIAFDNAALARANLVFANSRRVAERLRDFNRIEATPLYHPPADAESFRCEQALPYVFFPSRLETLKRQSLLIEAARHMHSPLKILLAGDGGQREVLARLIEQHDVGNRVALIGHVTEAEKRAFYARALAVVFPAFDEDYGYITLEAMLSSKPVITCTDSGGPLEFVRDGETGWIEPPDAKALAQRLDWLAQHPRKAADAGVRSLEAYRAANISWRGVIEQLTQPL
ncbi:glycosyltransferase family 4 protein [Paraburkholderia youngii]|uniref:Glycosyltransferase involved in cell wall biosynthesis n=1 Tax=Paraburkholderia youngii TaxID=2782701 RepID=A0A7W8L7W5_9BURK|nr:glycosyltransferase family 4 protein [Paraburkholderia youngii]MBB5401768.1 glycosyltransferase involved in cell wall biosynthesis [Paraburkholderia youngii]